MLFGFEAEGCEGCVDVEDDIQFADLCLRGELICGLGYDLLYGLAEGFDGFLKLF